MGWSKRLPNGRVKAYYRAPDGRERSKVFDLQRHADLWLSTNDVSKARGDWCDPRLARVPYGQWQPKWLETKIDLKPSTRATYERLIASHILPSWERVPLAAITHEDVAAWVASLTGKGLSASRSRQAFRVLSMTLAFAVTAGRLSRNPCDGVTLPRLPETRKRFLTHEQVHALADACGEYRPLVLLLAYTGLRWGEAAALRVRSVNLLRRRVAVSEAVVEIDGRLVYGTPKTHHRRSVPIPAFLVDDLTVLCAGKGASDLVFTSPEGAALREGNFRRRCFDRAAAAAGLPKLHPHELRHAAASLAVDAGANVKHVQRMLGHKSAAMTLDVYADLFEDGLDELADRMNAAAYRTLADSTQTRGAQGTVSITGARTRKAR